MTKDALLQRLSSGENAHFLRTALCVLILVGAPLLNALAVGGPTLVRKLDFSYHIQGPYLLPALALVLFVYLGWKKKPSHVSGRWLLSGAAAAALFAVVLWSHAPFFAALDAGVVRVTNSEILYDYGGLLGVRFPRDTSVLTDGGMASETLVLGPLPQRPELRGILDTEGTVDVRAVLNGHDYVVVSEGGEFRIPVERAHITVGENTLIIGVRGNGTISIARQPFYPTVSLVSADGGKSWQSADGRHLLWLRDSSGKTPPSESFPERMVRLSPARLFFFGLRPHLIFAAALLLAIALLGEELLSWARRAWPEACASLFGAVLLLRGMALLEQSWYVLGASIVKGVGSAFAMIYGDAVRYATAGVDCPSIALHGFEIRICSASSGVESMGYFTLLFLLVLATNWGRLKYGRCAVFFAIGLAGSTLVNMLRIALLLLAGVYISPEFSVGVFHTNAGWILFLGYAALYWYALIPLVRRPA